MNGILVYTSSVLSNLGMDVTEGLKLGMVLSDFDEKILVVGYSLVVW